MALGNMCRRVLAVGVIAPAWAADPPVLPRTEVEQVRPTLPAIVTDACGSFRMHADTVWSIELSAATAVAEWGGQEASFRAEQDGFYEGRSVWYPDGRQTAPTLIP